MGNADRDRCCSPPAARTASSRRRSPARPTSATAAPAVTDIHEFPGKGHSRARRRLGGGRRPRARLAPLPRPLSRPRCSVSHPVVTLGREMVTVEALSLFAPPLADEGFHPAVAAWFAPVPRRPHPGPARGVAAHRGRRRHAHRRPHRVGQDAGRLPGRHRQLYRAHARGVEVAGARPRWPTCPRSRPWPSTSRRTWSALREIAGVAAELGYDAPDLRVAVRTGDTTTSERAAMVRRPPNFVVTTPESLYLLVTAARSRAMLATVETVIVDEIHAVARDKRGPHLLTLERLERAAATRPQRIGLSATQRPIGLVADLLCGAGAPARAPSSTPGTAAASTWPWSCPGRARAGGLGRADGRRGRPHRRPGGRPPHHLHRVRQHPPPGRAPGPPAGRSWATTWWRPPRSLSKDRRHRVETRLRAGDLRALVATASLELGIDIGPVELVPGAARPAASPPSCSRWPGQPQPPRRARGRLFLTRDELVESAALLAAVQRGEDALKPPDGPLDILAQQIVAEVAAVGEEGWRLDELYDLVRRPPLPPPDPRGVRRGRGHGQPGDTHRLGAPGRLPAPRRRQRRGPGRGPPVGGDPGAPSPRSATSGWSSSRRSCSSARSTRTGRSSRWPATSSCSAPTRRQIRQVTAGTVRVVDAAGKPPTIPFWTGEAPAAPPSCPGGVPAAGPSTSAWRRATAAAPATGCGRRPCSTTPPSSRSWLHGGGPGRCWASSPPTTTWCSSGSSTTPRA